MRGSNLANGGVLMRSFSIRRGQEGHLLNLVEDDPLGIGERKVKMESSD